jgi:hypothetical protein
VQIRASFEEDGKHAVIALVGDGPALSGKLLLALANHSTGAFMELLLQLLLLSFATYFQATPTPALIGTTIPPGGLQFIGWDWTMFVWGCVGGVGPAVVMTLKMLVNGTSPRSKWLWAFVWLPLPVFAGLVTAGALLPPNPFVAIYSGATVPLMFAAFAGKEFTDIH